MNQDLETIKRLIGAVNKISREEASYRNEGVVIEVLLTRALASMTPAQVREALFAFEKESDAELAERVAKSEIPPLAAKQDAAIHPTLGTPLDLQEPPPTGLPSVPANSMPMWHLPFSKRKPAQQAEESLEHRPQIHPQSDDSGWRG